MLRSMLESLNIQNVQMSAVKRELKRARIIMHSPDLSATEVFILHHLKNFYEEELTKDSMALDNLRLIMTNSCGGRSIDFYLRSRPNDDVFSTIYRDFRRKIYQNSIEKEKA